MEGRVVDGSQIMRTLMREPLNRDVLEDGESF